MATFWSIEMFNFFIFFFEQIIVKIPLAPLDSITVYLIQLQSVGALNAT